MSSPSIRRLGRLLNSGGPFSRSRDYDAMGLHTKFVYKYPSLLKLIERWKTKFWVENSGKTYSYSSCSGSPARDGIPSESAIRSRLSFQEKKFKVEINCVAKLPLKSVSLALERAEPGKFQDALRVLDIIVRQQTAQRHF
ncbi:hypothetical protein CTI12_AA631120 [Artemisia annua]|uniref:Uncharacterized protein n=1 Tax=Artemisia annua TaxID=35608 RepID=A0A2U1K8S3_ARTAN|nr:hypothetical protein CTI12_AA631120 [Artemisia annua]